MGPVMHLSESCLPNVNNASLSSTYRSSMMHQRGGSMQLRFPQPLTFAFRLSHFGFLLLCAVSIVICFLLSIPTCACTSSPGSSSSSIPASTSTGTRTCSEFDLQDLIVTRCRPFASTSLRFDIDGLTTDGAFAAVGFSVGNG